MPRFLRDPVWWAALFLGLLLRALPLLIWGWLDDDCTRDECIFKITARPIVDGDGLGLAPRGWLPAPGYPYLLATCHQLFGSFESVKWVQWGLTPVLLGVMYALADRVGGRRAARWAAALTALHPTLVYYVGTMWTETVYSTLLAASVLGALWAREGGAARALLPGVLLGLTVLTRGVATYLPPLFLAALLVPGAAWAPLRTLRSAARARARHALVFLVGLVLTVAPYSVAATQRWGGLVISDATLGHVIALGNDDYPPVTFDYMNGQLTGELYARTLRKGRRDCPRGQGPLLHDDCEVQRAVAWIRAHPTEFVARIPVRLAQLFNPHSFLTRHVRWGFWTGLPWELKEAIVALQALFSTVIVVGGTLAACALARGPFGILAVGVVGYHVAVIAALYGLTRFRVPLEPLWLVFVCAALAHPRAAWAALRASLTRMGLALVIVPILAALVARYAWTGWPGL